MSSKTPLVATTENSVKEGNIDMETKPNVVDEAITHPIAKSKLTPKTKQNNHKHIKVKKINPSAINQTKLYHWMNQGLLKELKQKTQYEQSINQGLFHQTVYPIKVPT